MCVDLERDEDRHMWMWDNISGSEDYTLLPERGHDYWSDDYRTGEYVKIVRYLQRVAPHIRWRITFAGSDEEGANPSQWRVICVPESQYVEAETLFDRFLDGENLDEYCYTDKYPEIYDKLPDQDSKLNDAVVAFRKVMLDYFDVLESESDLSKFIEKMSVLLPDIYLRATRLPSASEAPIELSFSFHLGHPQVALSKTDPLLKAYNAFERRSNESSLIDLLVSIRCDTEQEVMALTPNDPDAIATAINDLKTSFSLEGGWGRDVIKALLEVHDAKDDIVAERRRQRR